MDELNDEERARRGLPPRDEKKGADFIQGSLGSVVAWLPDMPRVVKVVVGVCFLYLTFALVAQFPPTSLFEGIGRIADSFLAQRREAASEGRKADALALADDRQERRDMTALLLAQNAALQARLDTLTDQVMAEAAERRKQAQSAAEADSEADRAKTAAALDALNKRTAALASQQAKLRDEAQGKQKQ